MFSSLYIPKTLKKKYNTYYKEYTVLTKYHEKAEWKVRRQIWFYSVALTTSQTRPVTVPWASVFWLINKWFWATGVVLTGETIRITWGAASPTTRAEYHNAENVFWKNLSVDSNILSYLKLRTLKLNNL